MREFVSPSSVNIEMNITVYLVIFKNTLQVNKKVSLNLGSWPAADRSRARGQRAGKGVLL